MVLGIGAKPNVSSVVGALYEGHLARRDALLHLYMGINLGAMIGPIVAAGMLGENQLATRFRGLRRRDAARHALFCFHSATSEKLDAAQGYFCR